ncbi:hypothetical protein BJX62DRAFT_194139 [Aspergillus germanicus]
MIVPLLPASVWGLLILYDNPTFVLCGFFSVPLLWYICLRARSVEHRCGACKTLLVTWNRRGNSVISL